jgi:hypothetical protein
MLDLDPNEAAAPHASVDTGFDTTPVTATVSPAPAPVDTGFDDLGGTPSPVQPSAPTINAEADTGIRGDQWENGRVETGIEETATSHANASKGAAAAASVDASFDNAPVTATVSPASDPAPATVETGLGDLGMSNKPIPLQPNFANLPAELKSIPNWVLFRYVPPKRKGGKWRKVPFQPNGKTADTTRKSTWRRFDECTAAYAQGGFDGIGFVFDGEIGTDGLCYCGVDFDDCVDGSTIHSLALVRMRGLNTYTERSVSGTGVHCIARAKPLDRIVKFDGIEIYTTARYFVCTGLSTTGTIKAVPNEIYALVDEMRAKEAAAKKQKSNQPLSEGVETTRWFESLSGELKDEVVDCALGVVAKNTRLLELEANGGNNADYFKLTTSVARSGAPQAEDIFVKHAASAKDADPEDELRRYFGRCGASSPSGDQPITVGTLLRLAQQNGANFDGWKHPTEQQQTTDEPLFGDANAEFVGPKNASPYSVLMALHAKGAGTSSLFPAINQTFAVVKYGTQILVADIGEDICLMKVEDFHKALANIVVVRNDEEIAVSRLWFRWKDRRQYLGAGVVFQPGGPLEIKGDMLNLWRGFGIKPMPGDWSLLRDHIFKEVCSGRQEYFDYLINWMAYAVQHPDRPMGVAVAFLGAQGAGKGIVARTFGKFFGKHFAHIANGDQLTGRFNASIGMSCVVFLDEALWAGDKKGEGVLKALITEPSLQLEAKFRDPIRVENRLRIIVASNNDWAIPAGIGDRRWFVLNVAETFSGTAHQSYWDAVYNQIDRGGAAAMLHDLLSMDVSAFNVRAVPHTAAKALQQVHSLQGSMAWLHDVLQEGSVSGERWQDAGLTIEKDRSYMCYVEFSKRQRDWKPAINAVWSKNILAALGPYIGLTRPKKGDTRVRSFRFAPLDDCRRQFASHLCAPDLEWEVETQPDNQSEEAPEDLWNYDDSRLDPRDDEWEPETNPEQEYEIEDGSPD